MRLKALQISCCIEACRNFVILLVFEIAPACKPEIRCQVKYGTANISLALPDATNYAVSIINLQEGVNLQRTYQLEDSPTTPVFLLKQHLNFIRVVELIVDANKVVNNFTSHLFCSEGKASELCRHKVKNFDAEYHDHEWVRPGYDHILTKYEATRLTFLFLFQYRNKLFCMRETELREQHINEAEVNLKMLKINVIDFAKQDTYCRISVCSQNILELGT